MSNKHLSPQPHSLGPTGGGTKSQILESAEQAGFFASGDKTRLVTPVIRRSQNSEQPLPDDHKKHEELKKSGGGGEPPGVHTAIVGLLRELPAPGTAWPKVKKERFLGAFKATIDFIYPEPEEQSQ